MELSFSTGSLGSSFYDLLGGNSSNKARRPSEIPLVFSAAGSAGDAQSPEHTHLDIVEDSKEELDQTLDETYLQQQPVDQQQQSQSQQQPQQQQWCQNGNETAETSYNWDQYQWAVQWHEWQVKQREWQLQQRQFYLAKEEQRKAAIARGELKSASDVPFKPIKAPKEYKPSPLSRMMTVVSDRSSVLSTSSSVSFGNDDSRSLFRESLASSLLLETDSPLAENLKRAISRQSTVSSVKSHHSVLTSKSSVNSKASRSSSSMGMNNMNSNNRPGSIMSMQIIATSPEWIAPGDITRVGTTSSNKSSTSVTRKSTISSISSTSSSHNQNRLSRASSFVSQADQTALQAYTTGLPAASTFSLGGGTSSITPATQAEVLSISSLAPDGSVVTTQTVTVTIPRPASTLSQMSGYSASSSWTSMGTVGNNQSALNSPTTPLSAAAGGPGFFNNHQVGGPPMMMMPIEDDDGQYQYPVLYPHTPSNTSSNVSSSDEDAEDWDSANDELTLHVGDRVVIWKVFEDGYCEGYNVNTKEAGVFPLDVVCERGHENHHPNNMNMENGEGRQRWKGADEAVKNGGGGGGFSWRSERCQSLLAGLNRENGIGMEFEFDEEEEEEEWK
jgi:hypothetical protein